MSAPRTRYHLNVGGDFYVEDGNCLACMAPHTEAPELMGHDEEANHCYFKMQPQDAEQVYRALRAMQCSETKCLRYAGDDPDILRRLVEAGLTSLCDHETSSFVVPVLRKVATFIAASRLDEFAIATSFRDSWIGTASYHTATPVQHSEEGAMLEIAWATDRTGRHFFHPIHFMRREPSTGRSLVRHSPVPKMGSRAVALVIDDWLRADGRFSAIQWYSDLPAVASSEWQEHPL